MLKNDDDDDDEEEDDGMMMRMMRKMMMVAVIFGAPTAHQAHSTCFTFTNSLNANNTSHCNFTDGERDD